MNAVAMLVIALWVRTPIGMVLQPQDVTPYNEVADCWQSALGIMTDQRSPQVAFCMPGKPPGEGKANEQTPGSGRGVSADGDKPVGVVQRHPRKEVPRPY
jgi:hypothetical protein